MAKFNPPTNFSFDEPAEWPDWKQRFVRFRTATKLNKEEGAVQVSSLINAMGSESEDVFRLFLFAENEDMDDFDIILAKFDEYFVPRRNVIHEQACFHQRLQRPGEKAETFIRALYELSEHCDFGANREENIRDRIVVGILNKELSRKLQLMKDLTLAVTQGRSHHFRSEGDKFFRSLLNDLSSSRIQPMFTLDRISGSSD